LKRLLHDIFGILGGPHDPPRYIEGHACGLSAKDVKGDRISVFRSYDKLVVVIRDRWTCG
jgi:hypothetical protein